MKIEFDPIADALYVELSDSDVERSEEIRPGVILDYDVQGNVVGVEVLSVSKRSKTPALEKWSPEVPADRWRGACFRQPNRSRFRHCSRQAPRSPAS